MQGCFIRLTATDADDNKTIQVIIETPKGSRNKYAFDPKQKIFELKKVLPAGSFGMSAKTVPAVGDFIRPLTVETRYRTSVQPSYVLFSHWSFFATALFLDPRFTSRQPEQCNRDDNARQRTVRLHFSKGAFLFLRHSFLRREGSE